MLFLHGFGQDHRAFSSWTEMIPHDYTYLLIDLPFHGDSNWNTKKETPGIWRKVFELLLATERVKSFNLVGFSLGGKVAFDLFMIHGDRIKKLVLLAPDGIHVSPWYRLATFPLMQPLFYYFMTHEKAMGWAIQTIEKSGITKSSMVKFAKRELLNKDNRIRVFQSWVYLKKLYHKLSNLRKRMTQTETNIVLVLGKWDSIIPSKKLIPAIGEYVSDVYVLECKHDQLVNRKILPETIEDHL